MRKLAHCMKAMIQILKTSRQVIQPTHIFARAFSSEVDAGSRKENALFEEPDAPFRSKRIGKRYARTLVQCTVAMVSTITAKA
jgi:hypothetical protein